MDLTYIWYLGFRANKTSFPTDRSKWFLCRSFSLFVHLCICSFMCRVCVFLICSTSLILVVPREGCASGLWYFLGIFNYFSDQAMNHIRYYGTPKRSYVVIFLVVLSKNCVNLSMHYVIILKMRVVLLIYSVDMPTHCLIM